jgi:hypothetical protein
MFCTDDKLGLLNILVASCTTGSGIGTLSHLLRDNVELLSYFGFDASMNSTLAASRIFEAVGLAIMVPTCSDIDPHHAQYLPCDTLSF